MDGRAKFLIPVKTFEVDDPNELQSEKTIEALDAVWKEDSQSFPQTSLLRFFDIGELWLAIAVLVSYYRACVGEEPEGIKYQVAAVVDGTWRAVPFFDADIWGIHVLKYGLPVMNSDRIYLPNNSEARLHLPMTGKYPLWLEIGAFLGLAFGLPLDLNLPIIGWAVMRAAERAKSAENS